MFYLYVLRTERHNRWYIGTAEDVTQRLERHNAGLVRSTKPFAPWRVVYTEKFKTRAEARFREKTLKGSAHQRRKLYQKILS